MVGTFYFTQTNNCYALLSAYYDPFYSEPSILRCLFYLNWNGTLITFGYIISPEVLYTNDSVEFQVLAGEYFHLNDLQYPS